MKQSAAAHDNDRGKLAELLREARRLGIARIQDGEDLFEIRIVDDKLPEEARRYLMKGGPAR